jgi:hypothetical protein
MNIPRLPVVLVAALAVFFLASEALAQTPVDVLVGAKSGVSMPAGSEVPDYRNSDSGYYPSFGAGAAFGMALEVRGWDVVGLETGLHYSLDNATGWSDKTVDCYDLGRVFMDQETSALHIPLLLKAVAKTTTIRPFIGFGLEFVIQQSSDVSYRSEQDSQNVQGIEGYENHFSGRNRIATSSYKLLQLTAGTEVDLGELRVPIEVRAGYNLDHGDGFDDRVEIEQSDGSQRFVYNGEYKGHFGVFVGVLYAFDFVL